MTAEAIEGLWSRTRGRDWTWADLQEIPDDGHRYGPLKPAEVLLAVEVVSPSRRIDRPVKPAVLAEAGVPAYWRVELGGQQTPSMTAHELAGTTYREVRTVTAGSAAVVDVPFRVELQPAELAGPRRRS